MNLISKIDRRNRIIGWTVFNVMFLLGIVLGCHFTRNNSRSQMARKAALTYWMGKHPEDRSKHVVSHDYWIIVVDTLEK